MWKRVEDAFPAVKDEGYCLETDEVLIAGKWGISIGYARKYHDDDAEWIWYLSGRDMYRSDLVTHWMELPESPK